MNPARITGTQSEFITSAPSERSQLNQLWSEVPCAWSVRSERYNGDKYTSIRSVEGLASWINAKLEFDVAVK